MQLSRKVTFGAVLLAGSRLATRGLDALALIVIARILVPEDFGLVALAAAVLFVLNTITDISLSNALIQMEKPTEPAFHTAFTLNVLRGASLMALMVAAAWPYADFYGDPRLAPLLCALGLVPLIQGFQSPKTALLAKDLHFRPLVTREVAAKSGAFVISVAVAIWTESYWALVAGRIAAPAITVVTSYMLAPYRPRLGLSHWRDMIGFSGWITLAQTANAVNLQADRFFIAGELGKAALGHYSIASELAALPSQAPAIPITQALYSAFCRVRDDLDRFRSSYVRSQSMIVFLVLPLGLLTALLAAPLVHLALGPEWTEAIVIIQVLAPVFSIQLLASPAQSACMALNETRRIFVRDLIALAIRLPLILIGLYAAGMIGIVVARVISGLAMTVLNMQLASRLIHLSVGQQVLGAWRSLASAALAVAVCLFLSATLDDGINSGNLAMLVYMTIATTVFLATYLAAHLMLWWSAGRPNGVEKTVLGAAGLVWNQIAKGGSPATS